MEVKEVATFLVSHEGATVRRLTLSGNEITDGGKDMSGLTALCEILPTLKHPISLELANCGLGVAEVNELASAIQAGAAVNSVTVDSTGNMRNQKKYTLAAGQGKIELDDYNLGPADSNLISAWLATDAGAAVARLTVDGFALNTAREVQSWCNSKPLMQDVQWIELSLIHI